MKNIRQTEIEENSPDLLRQNKIKTRYPSKRKHKMIHFEWTITLIREFIWMQIVWVADKVFRNPLSAKKKNSVKKKQGQIFKAMIFL
jgi:hypothetical protein